LHWGCGGGDENRVCWTGSLQYNTADLVGTRPQSLPASISITLGEPSYFSPMTAAGNPQGFPMVFWIDNTVEGVGFESDFAISGVNYRFRIDGLAWVITQLTAGRPLVASGIITIV
jgi:hypothetical protein